MIHSPIACFRFLVAGVTGLVAAGAAGNLAHGAPQQGAPTVRVAGPSPGVGATVGAGPVLPLQQSARPPRIAPFTGTPRGAAMASGTQRPVVLLTGYWPPTNEAVRRFSQRPALNPGGWVGEDWMGRGYDVVSHFPTFANPNCNNCGIGMGDLEVDYQDTTPDFAAIVALHNPIAIITLSRGSFGTTWEVEMNQFNRGNWVNDFAAPFQPTPSPPDSTVESNAIRISALPAQAIVDAVAASGIPVSPFVCIAGSGGGFLSEFIAYLGVWYQATHADPTDPDWCVAAGHIHVGTEVSWADASNAVDVSLSTLLEYVDGVLACVPMQPYCPGTANSQFREAELTGIGNPSISSGDLEIVVQRAVRATSGLLFYGMGIDTQPLGDGSLCISAPLTRIPAVVQATDSGVLRFPLDYQSPPLTGISAGMTVNFQAWYRDNGSLTGSNTSSALTVTFCP